MKTLKYITQILTALVYTPIYTGIMYLAIVFPVMWIISLSTWKMILALIVLSGLIQGIIMMLQTLGSLPYTWIVKENKTSLVISIGLCAILPLYNIYSVWRILLGNGTWAFIAGVIITFMILQFVLTSIGGILEVGND